MTRTATLVAYAAIAAAAAGLEITARRGHAAALGATLAAAARRRPVRALLLAGWLWLGWHVFVRVDWQ